MTKNKNKMERQLRETQQKSEAAEMEKDKASHQKAEAVVFNQILNTDHKSECSTGRTNHT